MRRVFIVFGVGLAISSTVFATSFEDAVALVKRGHPAEGRKAFEELARSGDGRGNFGLGMMYQNGVGVERNYDLALKYYRDAAQKNVVEAMQNLGFMYQHGLGTKKNMQNAVAWYSKAAEMDFGPSEYDLAWLYQTGEGIPVDYTKARTLYQKAIKHGMPDAMYNLGMMYQSGSGISRDYGRAVALYEQASALHYAPALYQLGYCYYKGQGVEKNMLKSYTYMRAAQMLGDENAGNQLHWPANKLTASDITRADASAKSLAGIPTKP